MANEFRLAQVQLAGQVEFDLMLGGINTHGTQPIGDYGRRFLMKLWREVVDTTGQDFGFKLPEQYVHNSMLACMAIEAVRDLIEAPPFEYLHAVQERFFVHGENINDLDVLYDLAPDGLDSQSFSDRVHAPGIVERVKFQFDNAGAFGTTALPSLLVEGGGKLQLLAGGYVDAQMLVELVHDRVRPA
jgi:protein-disulfide isomerase-like protein with CxxC motif